MTLLSRTAATLAVLTGHAPAPDDDLGPTASDARRRLLDTISSGALAPGERLGGERDLAAELGVSRATVRAALTALENDGVVDRVRGRGGGTFVARRKVERDLSRIVGVPELLRSQGFAAGTRVVSAAVASADDAVARALRLPAADGLVYEVVRLRLADGEPISLEHARFPAHRFPGMLERPLGGSLYEMLAEQYRTTPAEAVEQIEVVGAGTDEAALLSVAVAAPLLSLTRTTCDEFGEPFEYARDLFRADRTRLVVRSSQPSGWRHSATSAPQTR
jgi:GntR family transcriptional regulator